MATPVNLAVVKEKANQARAAIEQLNPYNLGGPSPYECLAYIATAIEQFGGGTGGVAGGLSDTPVVTSLHYAISDDSRAGNPFPNGSKLIHALIDVDGTRTDQWYVESAGVFTLATLTPQAGRYIGAEEYLASVDRSPAPYFMDLPGGSTFVVSAGGTSTTSQVTLPNGQSFKVDYQFNVSGSSSGQVVIETWGAIDGSNSRKLNTSHPIATTGAVNYQTPLLPLGSEGKIFHRFITTGSYAFTGIAATVVAYNDLASGVEVVRNGELAKPNQNAMVVTLREPISSSAPLPTFDTDLTNGPCAGAVATTFNFVELLNGQSFEARCLVGGAAGATYRLELFTASEGSTSYVKKAESGLLTLVGTTLPYVFPIINLGCEGRYRIVVTSVSGGALTLTVTRTTFDGLSDGAKVTIGAELAKPTDNATVVTLREPVQTTSRQILVSASVTPLNVAAASTLTQDVTLTEGQTFSGDYRYVLTGAGTITFETFTSTDGTRFQLHDSSPQIANTGATNYKTPIIPNGFNGLIRVVVTTTGTMSAGSIFLLFNAFTGIQPFRSIPTQRFVSDSGAATNDPVIENISAAGIKSYVTLAGAAYVPIGLIIPYAPRNRYHFVKYRAITTDAINGYWVRDDILQLSFTERNGVTSNAWSNPTTGSLPALVVGAAGAPIPSIDCVILERLVGTLQVPTFDADLINGACAAVATTTFSFAELINGQSFEASCLITGTVGSTFRLELFTASERSTNYVKKAESELLTLVGTTLPYVFPIINLGCEGRYRIVLTSVSGSSLTLNVTRTTFDGLSNGAKVTVGSELAKLTDNASVVTLREPVLKVSSQVPRFSQDVLNGPCAANTDTIFDFVELTSGQSFEARCLVTGAAGARFRIELFTASDGGTTYVKKAETGQLTLVGTSLPYTFPAMPLGCEGRYRIVITANSGGALTLTVTRTTFDGLATGTKTTAGFEFPKSTDNALIVSGYRISVAPKKNVTYLAPGTLSVPANANVSSPAYAFANDGTGGLNFFETGNPSVSANCFITTVGTTFSVKFILEIKIANGGNGEWVKFAESPILRSNNESWVSAVVPVRRSLVRISAINTGLTAVDVQPALNLHPDTGIGADFTHGAELAKPTDNALVVENRPITSDPVGSIPALSDQPLLPGKKIRSILVTDNNATLAIYFVQIHSSSVVLATGAVPLNGWSFRISSLGSQVFGAGDFGNEGRLFSPNTRVALSSTFSTFTPIAAARLNNMALSIEVV